MSKDISKVLLKLLPQGDIFTSASKPLREFLLRLSHEFERVKSFTEAINREIPGQLNRYLSDWEAFLALDGSRSLVRRQQAIIAKLSSSGGQSLAYLTSSLSHACGYRVSVENSSTPMMIEVLGITMEAHHFTCRSLASQPLRSFQRDKSAVEAASKIMHAHLDVRFFDHKRTEYAKD